MKEQNAEPGMAAHADNTSTQEAEDRREFQAILDTEQEPVSQGKQLQADLLQGWHWAPEQPPSGLSPMAAKTQEVTDNQGFSTECPRTHFTSAAPTMKRHGNNTRAGPRLSGNTEN